MNNWLNSYKKIISFAITCIFSIHLIAQVPLTSISGRIESLRDSDIATLTIDKYGAPWFPDYQTSYTCRITNHSFHFKIPVPDYPTKFQLGFKERMPGLKNDTRYNRIELNFGLIKNKDSIYITERGENSVFSGKGSEKLGILQQISSIYNSFAKGIPFAMPSFSLLYFRNEDSATIHSLAYLQTQRQFLNKDEFNIIKAFILAHYYGKGNFLYMMTDSMRSLAISNLQSYQSKIPSVIFDPKVFNQLDILQYSEFYTNALITQYIYDSCYTTHTPFLIRNCYTYLFSHYNGALRERLITNLLYNYRTNPQDLAFLIKDALSFVRKEDFKVILEKLQSSRIKGATAYNFSLPDSEGKMHTLSEYRGKAVFIDFWFTGCGNCVRIAPYLTEIEQHFKGKPVVFVSVNVDQDKQQWLRSIKSGKYSSKYVTNLYTNGLGLEHPICRYYNIDGYPTLILINKQGYLLNNPIDPRKDNGRNLISLINQEINN